MSRRLLRLAIAALAGAAAPVGAQGYDENPGGRPLYLRGEVRLVAADGERSWLDDGLGKARFGGGTDRDLRLRPQVVEGDAVWQPQLGFALGATVAAIAQRGQARPVDPSEAYLTWRRAPVGGLHLSARTGLLWPPVSLEHGGPAWTVTETITPSAIASWVGEEVKVAAAELTASLPTAGGRLSLTAAPFALNDTAGTLLSFRGWALHDEKATAFGRQPLPPLDPFMRNAQAPYTNPVITIDHRVGGYARLGWARGGTRLQAFYYDNRGDPGAVTAALQWGWRTRFAALSAQARPGGRTTLTVQALSGATHMGYPIAGRIWVDTGFRAAFLLATRRIGAASSVSGRIEAFGTRGRGSVLDRTTSEDGWALTLAGRRPIGAHLELLGEALHLASTRADRRRLGLAPYQAQTVVQLALRATL